MKHLKITKLQSSVSNFWLVAYIIPGHGKFPLFIVSRKWGQQVRTHGSAQWIIQRVRISSFHPIRAWVKLKRLAWAVALPCQRLHVWHQDIHFWDELAFCQPHYTPGRKMQDSSNGVGEGQKETARGGMQVEVWTKVQRAGWKDEECVNVIAMNE